MRLYGDEAVMVVANRQVVLHRPDGSVEEYRLVEGDGGYYNELLNFYDAIVHGTPIVGTMGS